MKKIGSNLSHDQKQMVLMLLNAWRWPRDWIVVFLAGLKWSYTWRFFGFPLFQFKRGSTVTIGKNFVCTSNSRHNSIGVNQRVVLKTMNGQACLRIGENVGLSGVSISASDAITIGSRVLLGSGCMITDSDAHPLSPGERHEASQIKRAPIVIGDDCFIGARSIILKGVTIGCGSVIGAGSVVVSNIPAGVIAAGNPAKVIKAL